MNGRIQRWQLGARCVLALLVWMLFSHAGAPGWGLFAAVLGFWIHVPVIAVLFLLLLRVNRGRSAPGVGELLRAFIGELWAVERVFSWQQPFAAEAFADFLPPDCTRRGVLLLHGYTCNRGLWNTWMPRLQAAGHPHIALTLEPAYGQIEDYAEAIEAAVLRLTACTGRTPLIVAHSMGGLALRAWAAHYGAVGRVQRCITLGTPHFGTLLARLAHTPNARQMRHRGEWLGGLAGRELPLWGAGFDCFYSACDQIVCPAQTAVLPGSHAVLLPATGHLAMVFHPAVFAEVQKQLRL